MKSVQTKNSLFCTSFNQISYECKGCFSLTNILVLINFLTLISFSCLHVLVAFTRSLLFYQNRCYWIVTVEVFPPRNHESNRFFSYCHKLFIFLSNRLACLEFWLIYVNHVNFRSKNNGPGLATIRFWVHIWQFFHAMIKMLASLFPMFIKFSHWNFNKWLFMLNEIKFAMASFFTDNKVTVNDRKHLVICFWSAEFL